MPDWYEKKLADFFADAFDMLTKKRRMYAADTDPLANFKETAEFLQMTPEQALLPHLYKHFRNIANAIQRGERLPKDSLIDASNYLNILHVIDEEHDADTVDPG